MSVQDTGFMIREDQFAIHVQINHGKSGWDFPSTTSWTSMSGGALTAQDTFTRPGGMVPGKNIGGPTQRGDVTVTRQYTMDMHPWVMALDQSVGVANMTVAWYPLDANNAFSFGTPSGFSEIYNRSYGGYTGWQLGGVLKEVGTPTIDANANAVGFLTLVMGANVEIVRVPAANLAPPTTP